MTREQIAWMRGYIAGRYRNDPGDTGSSDLDDWDPDHAR